MALLDVAKEIKLDHDNVRDLFARYMPPILVSIYSSCLPSSLSFTAATAVDEKAAIANTLIREMAIHSDAECVTLDLLSVTSSDPFLKGDLRLQRDGKARPRRHRRP
jgi:hypothetical protein